MLDSWIKWLVRRKKLEFVKTSRASEEERKNRKIHLSDLESTEGLVKVEKSMLKDLLTNGIIIPFCCFNEKGHVEFLAFRTFENVSEQSYFPCLHELWIPYENQLSINFINRHQSSLKFLKLQKLDKIPDLSSLVNLIRLDISHNSIKSFNWFGRFLRLQDLDISNNHVESLQDIGILSSYKTLKRINLMQNQISDIKGFESLSCMKNLQFINLSYNNLNHLKIKINIPKLVSLSL